MREVDDGIFKRNYDANYWQAELSAAKERSYGPALARVSELLLYARKPVQRFIDIGAGPGFLLDALSLYLPTSKDKFWGVELFPPLEHTAHANYFIGSLDDIGGTFDAGVCIEVFEHLTPSMLRILAKSLASKSTEDSIYLINTGLPSFVRHEDPTYLDPYGRGHVASYSLKAIELMFNPHGFRVLPLSGKTWAYLLEYKPSVKATLPAQDRIWTADRHNRVTPRKVGARGIEPSLG